MKEFFEHIFEHEREFRTAVATTASGKRGLYFNDALEEPSQHTDYYSRFENDWEAKRYVRHLVYWVVTLSEQQ